MKDQHVLKVRNGMKLGEAGLNLFQFSVRFVVKDINSSKVLYVKGKIAPSTKSSQYMTVPENFLKQ